MSHLYVSVAEMVSIEKQANNSGWSYDQMMAMAGLGLAQAISNRYSDLAERRVLGLVGSGNNGGDTLVALAHLAKWGWTAQAYIVRDRPPGDPLVDLLIQAGGDVFTLQDDREYALLHNLVTKCTVLLDGVLGTGIKLPLHGQIAEVLARVKGWLEGATTPAAPIVVAVDCPSGIDCDSGETAGESLPADMTVSMAAYKQGLLKFPAYSYLGDILVVDIGLPGNLPALQAARRFVVDEQWVMDRLPKRPLDAHKGTFGTALVVAGSRNYTGAALLAGEAAYRIGAGLVTIALPEYLHPILSGHLPEATWLPLTDEEGCIAASAAPTIQANLDRPSAVLIGPGFGMALTTQEFLARIFPEGDLQAGGLNKPLVIDADGLKLIASLTHWSDRLPKRTILTPHPGEMGHLTGISINEIQDDRLGTAERFAVQWGHVVVLKGAFTVIAGPEGCTAIIPVASPALARAGTGDVLAGVITGLLAQGLDAFEAAAAGAWLHAQAGLYAEAVTGNSASILAGDLLSGLVGVLSDLTSMN